MSQFYGIISPTIDEPTMSWNEQITVSRINNLKKNAKSVINRPTHLLKIQLRKSDKITTFAPPTITPPPIDAATVPSSPRPERWDLDLNLHHLKAAAKTLNEPWIFSSMQWTPFPLTFPPQSHLSPTKPPNYESAHKWIQRPSIPLSLPFLNYSINFNNRHASKSASQSITPSLFQT